MVLLHLPDGKIISVKSGTVEEILISLQLNPYEILVTKNGELLLSDEFVKEDDELVATSIVHGG